MAMTITTTVDNEVEGVRVSDALEAKLFASLNALDKSRAPEEMVKTYMSLLVQLKDNVTAQQARSYVEAQITRVS